MHHSVQPHELQSFKLIEIKAYNKEQTTNSMRINILIPFIIAATAFSACQSNDVFDTNASKDTTILSKFSSFENVRTVTLDVDYGVNTKVYFKIYDTNPFVETDGGTILSDSIQSIGMGATDDKGHYNASISVPSSLAKLYIVSTDAYVYPVLAKTISGDIVKVTAADKDDENTKGTRSFLSNNLPVIPAAMSSALGETITTLTGTADAWDANGTIVESLRVGNIAGTTQFYNAGKIIASSLGENKKPTAYLMGKDYNTDLIKSGTGDIILTYLYGISGAQSTLAYYCYTKDNPTTNDIKALKKCIIFANTFDYSGIAGPMNALRGVQVKLKYIDKNGIFQDSWPDNAKIGFVLYNGSWKSGKLLEAYYSTPMEQTTLYTNENPVEGRYQHVFTSCSTLSYTYDDKNYTMLGIEGYKYNGTEGDFNDVVIQLSGVEPTIGIDTKEDSTKTSTRGVLGFEDNWPARGDYDMNDMVVKYNTTYTFGRLTQSFNNKQISQTDYKKRITDEFTLTWTGANYKNGFGYEVTLDNDALTDQITIEHNGKTEKANVVSEGNNKFIIYLFNDAKAELGVSGYTATNMPTTVEPQTYKVTIPYKNTDVDTLKYADRAFNPFIFVNGDKTKEVHLIDHAPTTAGTACAALFNTNNDCSITAKSQYFRSNTYMPYAIMINAGGTDETNGKAWNISLRTESQPIYETYTNFTKWAEEGNTSTIKWWE